MSPRNVLLNIERTSFDWNHSLSMSYIDSHFIVFGLFCLYRSLFYGVCQTQHLYFHCFHCIHHNSRLQRQKIKQRLLYSVKCAFIHKPLGWHYLNSSGGNLLNLRVGLSLSLSLSIDRRFNKRRWQCIF